MKISRRKFVAASTAMGLSMQTTAKIFKIDHDVFVIASSRQVTPVLIDPQDFPGVTRAANDLAQDIGRVSGTNAAVISTVAGKIDSLIIAGTLGRSTTLDKLVHDGKINVEKIRG